MEMFPEGEYLGRFSTSSKSFKIAINMGNIAKDLGTEQPKQSDSPESGIVTSAD